jgi:hypothetical protein
VCRCRPAPASTPAPAATAATAAAAATATAGATLPALEGGTALRACAAHGRLQTRARLALMVLARVQRASARRRSGAVTDPRAHL